jgi:hypothetical protein
VGFVNRQGGEEERNEVAGADDVIDFDPDDPTVVKVHYDLAGWSIDQRAELAEALAEAGLPHAWDGEELVVPEIVEGETDAVFERLEEVLGPFAITLGEDEDSTEFGLDEWSESDRAVLSQSLIESEIPHRWDGTTVIVARDAEDVVDDLLDAIEEGELLGADEDAAGPPEGALGAIFLAADRLAREPLDARARRSLLDLHGELDRDQPPYAFAPRTWSRAVAGVGEIVDLVTAEGRGEQRGEGRGDGPAADGASEQSGDEVAARADALRTLLRPYV